MNIVQIEAEKFRKSALDGREKFLIHYPTIWENSRLQMSEKTIEDLALVGGANAANVHNLHFSRGGGAFSQFSVVAKLLPRQIPSLWAYF